MSRDAERAAQFFETAFDMARVRKGRRSIHVSDGVMNIALLQVKTPEDPIGLSHFGIWADDFASTQSRAIELGATCVQGPPTETTGFYGAKFKDPEGVVFDLTHTGWPGRPIRAKSPETLPHLAPSALASAGREAR